MNPRLTHLALHVAHLDACVDFYQRYCAMHVCHRRQSQNNLIVWMAEEHRDQEFVFVLMGHGHAIALPDNDYRHLGFAVASKQRVDELSEQAAKEGCLLWPPRQEPFPVGYYCGVKDPDGNQGEFSVGQPLGPGAESDWHH